MNMKRCRLWLATAAAAAGLPLVASAQPVNDDCVDAIDVGALPAQVMGDTTLATLDVPADDCGLVINIPGVWYSVSGTGFDLTASICTMGGTGIAANADYDTKMHVYSGDCTTPVCEGSNDDSCRRGSEVTWTSTMGTTYFILVHGFDGTTPPPTGTFTMDITDAGPPPTGACCQTDGTCADGLTQADCEAGGGTYQGDTVLCFDVVTCLGACCAPDGTCTDVSADACATSGGVFQGAGTDCLSTTCPIAPANDLCADAIDVGSLPALVMGDTSTATVDIAPECGTTITAPGVWYSVSGTGNTMTATMCLQASGAQGFDTKISVYCNTCAELSCVGGNDDFCGGGASEVSWCSDATQTYFILVHGFLDGAGAFIMDVTDDGVACTGAVQCAPGACCLCDGTCIVTTQADCADQGGDFLGDPDCIGAVCPGAPANNDSATPDVLTVDMMIGNNLVAGTMQCADGTDLSSCGADVNDVWYVAATTSGNLYRADVTNVMGGNSVVSIFDDGLGTTEFACADLFEDDNSGVTFVSPGNSVFIRVGSGDNITFDIEMNELPFAPNDDCIDAALVACDTVTAGSTANATFDDESTLGTCGTAITAPGVWYSVVGTGGDITASTCFDSLLPGSTTFDTKISVFDGDCAMLNCIGGNDDSCTPDSRGSEFTWASAPGTTYFILVHGFGTSTGDFEVSVQCAAATGACIDSSACAMCTIENEADCIAAGSAYQGDGSTCPAPAATGACCLAASCIITCAADCTAQSGTYLGDDSDCGSPGFGGSDSMGDWTITVNDDAGGDVGIFESWSVRINGTTYAGAVVNLAIDSTLVNPNVDVITVPDAVTIVTVEVDVALAHTFAADLEISVTSPGGVTVELTNDLGGANHLGDMGDPTLGAPVVYTFSDAGVQDWSGPAVDPVPAGVYSPIGSLNSSGLGACAEGACVIASNCNDDCSTTTADACALAGGTYLGDQTACPAADLNGACCLGDGTCVETCANDCGILGGTYLGDGTACPTGDAGFGDTDSMGDWTLTIEDDAGGDSGTWADWSIDINGTVYSSAPLSIIIGTGTGQISPATDIITVPDSVNITNVDVTVGISHTFAADMVISITGPTGVTRLLTDDLGGANHLGDMGDPTEGAPVNYTFSDSGTQDWDGPAVDPVPAGVYSPIESLSTSLEDPCDTGCICEFGGDAATVDVQDLLSFLSFWFVNDPAADINGGGVDVTDLLDFLACWFPSSAAGVCI